MPSIFFAFFRIAVSVVLYCAAIATLGSWPVRNSFLILGQSMCFGFIPYLLYRYVFLFLFSNPAKTVFRGFLGDAIRLVLLNFFITNTPERSPSQVGKIPTDILQEKSSFFAAITS
jgi:hypothetical protein